MTEKYNKKHRPKPDTFHLHSRFALVLPEKPTKKIRYLPTDKPVIFGFIESGWSREDAECEDEMLASFLPDPIRKKKNPKKGGGRR